MSYNCRFILASQPQDKKESQHLGFYHWTIDKRDQLDELCNVYNTLITFQIQSHARCCESLPAKLGSHATYSEYFLGE